MRWKTISFLLLASFVAGCSSVPPKPTPIAQGNLEQFQKSSAKFNSVVAIPTFETTTNEITTTVTNAIADGTAALDRIGKLTSDEVNFTNTVRALDDLGFELGTVDNRLSLIQETSTNAAMRDVATDSLKILEGWMVGIDYRDDVYRAVKAYADTKPVLAGEDAKLLFETMRDYRRAGLDLPRSERDEVERMRKELSSDSTDFEENIEKAKLPVKFTKAELEGVPDDFLKQVKTGDDEYTLMANITWHYLTILDNAKREDTRKKFLIAQCNLARDENIPLLQKILVLRDGIAHKLGYTSFADYDTETKMVKNAATAIAFEKKLETGLQPKLDAELEEFRKL